MFGQVKSKPVQWYCHVCKVPIVVPLTRSHWFELSDEKYIRLCSKRCLDLYNLAPEAD